MKIFLANQNILQYISVMDKRIDEIWAMLDKPCPDCASVNEPHSCPYAEEIDGDFSENYCTCCESCTDRCLRDI